MELFIAICEQGSFSRAAHKFGLSPSVLSRHMSALEEHLQTKLLSRSTRRISLTDAGRQYFEKSKEILSAVARAENEITHEGQALRGMIRLSLPISYGVRYINPLLVEFATLHPKIILDLHYSDEKSDVIHEGFTLALRITRDLSPGQITRKIGNIKSYVVASPEYLRKHGTPQHPNDLLRHQCLGYMQKNTTLSWLFMIDGQKTSLSIRQVSRITANNGEVLTQAAIQGLGIALEPEFIVASHIAQKRLVPILTDFPIPDLFLYALLPSNQHIPQRLRVLIDFLSERIG